MLCTVVVLITACSSGGKSVIPPTTVASAALGRSLPTSVSSGAPSGSTTTAATTTAIATTAAASAAAAGSTPATDVSGDPVLDPSGKVDADVVVQVFDTLKFDKSEYQGKSDLTIGLFDQGAMHHTLLVEGQKNFKLDVLRRGDAKVGDILLDSGTYTIYCELPGHRAAGMKGEAGHPVADEGRRCT